MNSTKPVILYAYLDISNPLVAWEVAIGRMKSTSNVTRDDFGLSIWQFGLIEEYIHEGLNCRLINEFILEHVRQIRYPDKVSRLNGLYFFENLEDVKFAIRYWGIPLNESYISEVLFYPDAYTKVDSEWITDKINKEPQEYWMDNYWSGKQKSSSPLYEVLATGLGVIRNNDLRQRAYKDMIENYPESTPLLAMATCAFHYKEINTIARIIPGMSIKDDELCGGYYIDINDLDKSQPEIIGAINLAKQDKKFPTVLKPTDPSTFFSLPDFQRLGFSTRDKNIIKEFRGIHTNRI